MHRVVPELIVENYREGRYNGEFQAVSMFLDLSGFSTMTDALMQHGQHGAEVLAGLMHGVFDPLVESIFDYGGKIIGFAGDGIMALYPIEADARFTALRAITSAHVIQKRFQDNPTRQTVYGEFSIFAKIGLGSGSVSWGILRSARGDQAAYYFRGSAVDEAAEAEHHAKAGEILLTGSIYELLRESIQSTPHAAFQRFHDFSVETPQPVRVVFPPVDLRIACHFMPEDVIANDVRGEFRQVVNLFMRFPDLSADALQNMMSTVFELRTRYGGLVSRLDFGDKGCNMLMLWGAPIAYENDIGRALNFLLDLKAAVDFPITAGVTYYISHAGYLGSSLYEDYTCYGWGVNLASRFMMTARPGEIWVDDRIARRVARSFELDFVGSQSFKGFASEQKVYLLRGYAQTLEPLYRGELVGRKEELAQLAAFTEPLWQDRFAGLLLLSGEAGIGKGRLVHEFHSSTREKGKRALWAVCQSNQILRQSFNPLRSWLLRYFGISRNQPMQEQKPIFDAKLDHLLDAIREPELAQELQRTRSILGALLNLHWEDSLYEQLDAEGRYNNTFLALIALLKAESLRQPVVLILEDLQFTDKDSKDFLPRLKRAILAAGESYPIAIIVTSRPPGLGLAKDLIDARIDLRAISPEAMAHLAEIRLGGPPEPELVNLLVERSEGNPYFVEQILRYLQEENMLETGQTGWRLAREIERTFLPGDIRSILVARLDQLARGVRESIQTASVLGREFEIPLLAHMWRQDDLLRLHITEAEQAGVWSPLDDLHYVFSHGLLRDAAYEMQMQARRRELHALALEALEHLYGDVKSRYAELAHHAKYGGLASKAQKYYTLAGKIASESYQNHQSIEYYKRALAFTPLDDLKTQFDLLMQRVELFNRIGNRSAQGKDLEALGALSVQLGDTQSTAKVLMLRASYYFATGDYLTAIDCAQQGESTSTYLANTELGLYTQLVWSLALLRLGRLDESMRRAQAAFERVRFTGNRREEARVLTSMGLIALEQKEPAHAQKYLVEALAIAREIKDLSLQARTLNNLARFEETVQRNYVLARDYYEQSYRLTRDIGDRSAECLALGNLGFVAGMQGDFLAAHSYHEQALLIAREVGNRYQETYTLINLSAVKGINAEADSALQYAQQAAELSQSISERSGEAWAMLYMGHAYLLHDEVRLAQAAYRKSIEIREDLGQPSLAMEPLGGLIESYLQADDLDIAWQEGQKLLNFLESGATLDGTEEPLRVYYACYRLLVKKQDPRSQQVLQTAIHLLEMQVSNFRDEAARTLYIENIPWRRAIWDLARS